MNGLQPNTIYSIKIEASETQTIKTLEEVPEGAPEDVSVKSISSEALKIISKVIMLIY